MPNNTIILDSNVLVAIISNKDSLRERAGALITRCEQTGVSLIYFDCVIAETLSVLGRRAEEQNRLAEFPILLERLFNRVPEASIVWLTEYTHVYFKDILELMRQSNGTLNFNDCLIALGCRYLGYPQLASFDRDFDTLTWISRISTTDNPFFDNL